MSPRSIIVGVDNSPGSHQAVHWAAEEAKRTERELVVLSAFDWHVVGARFQVSGAYADALRDAAEETVRSSVADAQIQAPRVNVRGQTAVGPVGRALAEAAAPGDMIVVGNRGRGGFASLLLGSVGHYIATHAYVPVVVVRGRRDPDTGPVVVGVDTAHSDTALQCGFEEASSRGTRLVAVHAYMPFAPVVAYGVLPGAEEDRQRWHDEALKTLREAVTVWAEKYPDVTVELAAVVGHPTEVLVGLSTTAQLVVVGHRGGGLGQIQLGRVASQLLHHANSSVMIARTSDETK